MLPPIEHKDAAGKVVGKLHWSLPTDDIEGVVQILDIQVLPDHQRKGVGKALYIKLLTTAAHLANARGAKLRRVWCATEQKRQLPARSFLTSLGFHHVATVKNLHRDQDTMIYSKSLD